jgi:hypothetical protein
MSGRVLIVAAARERARRTMLCEDSKFAAVLKLNFAISFAVAAFIPPSSNCFAGERLLPWTA